jgi:DNA polymerase III epsilon subunit-like protein
MTSVIDFLKGKNVFVFDTETTGLPERTAKWGTYWDYKMNDKYESSRIVSIAWASIHNFDKNNITDTNTNEIHHHLRYPEGFTEIPTTHIHGISLQETLTQGLPFGLILSNHDLAIALIEADYIIAHNVGFDYNVLMNELYRIVSKNDPPFYNSLLIKEKANLCMEHLEDLNNMGHIICTGQLSTKICKIEFPTKNVYLGSKKNYKMPKLIELYNYYYGCDFENAHSAEGDVKALIACLAKM